MRCIRCKVGEGGTRLCSDCRRELNGRDIDVQEVRGLFEQALGRLLQADHAGAIPVLEELVRRDERNLGAYENLILAQGRCARFEQATATLSAMHHVHPIRVLAHGQEPGAAGSPTLVEEPPEEESAIDLVSLGLFYRQFHHLDLAAKVLKRVLKANHENAEAHLVYGSICREKGKPRLAIKYLRQAQARGGESAAVLYELGLCYEMLRQVKKAHEMVSKAIALEPDNPHMHFTLGMLYEKLRKSKLARREYRVASSLNPAFAPALIDISFRLGIAALEEGNIGRALQEFQAGVRENPDLFAPTVMSEIDHMVIHLVRGEQFQGLLQELPALRRGSRVMLRALEEIFGVASRLAFYVGLSLYWDGYYDGQACSDGDRCECTCSDARQGDPPQAGAYEPAEPEATWLEGLGPCGRMVRGATSHLSRSRGRRAPFKPFVEVDDEARRVNEDETTEATDEIVQGEPTLGMPPVPFEFIFEEWLNVQVRLSSKRVADRPLVSPDTYQRLINILGACLRRAQPIVQRLCGATRGEADEQLSGPEDTELATALWACIIEGYLLRVALERCRSYPRELLARLAVAERHRQQRFFGRSIRALEAALPLLPESASLRNFVWNLCIREGRFAEAARRCQEVLTFTPHYLFQAAAYNDLAYCMVESGENLNLALLYSEKARELVPRLFDAHVADTTAWMHYRQGNFEEALRLIDEVIRAGRSLSSPLVATSVHYYHYGQILRALGRNEEAEEALGMALEMEVDADSDWGVARRLQVDSGRDES